MRLDWYDIIERAIWTFIQGALGAVTAVPLVTDVDMWENVGVAAATGGIAALISFLKTLSQERLNVVPDTRVSAATTEPGISDDL